MPKKMRMKMGMGALPPKGMEWTVGKTAGAIEAVNKLVADVRDRAGGDEFWGSIDQETQNEIKGDWAEIIMAACQKTVPAVPKE